MEMNIDEFIKWLLVKIEESCELGEEQEQRIYERVFTPAMEADTDEQLLSSVHFNTDCRKKQRYTVLLHLFLWCFRCYHYRSPAKCELCIMYDFTLTFCMKCRFSPAGY